MIHEERMNWTLKEHFDFYTNLIESKHPFSFVRWGDGELAVAMGQPVGEQSLVNQNQEWVFKEGGRTKLGDALNKSLELQGPENHYGIPCRCCASMSEHMALIPTIQASPIAPNTVFGNANYSRFLEWIKTLDEKGIKVSLVVNHKGQENIDKYPFTVEQFFGVPDNCIIEFEKNGDMLVEQLSEWSRNIDSHFVMVAAGPMSEVFITEMWKANPNNIYFDIGSSLDIYTKNGFHSRPHHDLDNHYAQVECRMSGPFNRPY